MAYAVSFGRWEFAALVAVLIGAGFVFAVWALSKYLQIPPDAIDRIRKRIQERKDRARRP